MSDEDNSPPKVKDDEISSSKLDDFREQVVEPVGLEDRQKLKRKTWVWLIENDIHPHDLERTLHRYSLEFSGAASGKPLFFR
jgi:hypothetical protein